MVFKLAGSTSRRIIMLSNDNFYIVVTFSFISCIRDIMNDLFNFITMAVPTKGQQT